MISANSFWDWFKVNNSQFFFLNQINNNEEKERIMNVLQEKLAEYCQSLYFEIGGHPDESQDLIISAGGDTAYFQQVEHLVNAAPQIDNWNIIAFKQPVNENFKIKYGNVSIDTERAWFNIQEGKDQGVDIDIVFENYQSKHHEEYLSVSRIILETILGEKIFNEKIGLIYIYNCDNHNIEELDQLRFLSDAVQDYR